MCMAEKICLAFKTKYPSEEVISVDDYLQMGKFLYPGMEEKFLKVTWDSISSPEIDIIPERCLHCGGKVVYMVLKKDFGTVVYYCRKCLKQAGLEYRPVPKTFLYNWGVRHFGLTLEEIGRKDEDYLYWLINKARPDNYELRKTVEEILGIRK